MSAIGEKISDYTGQVTSVTLTEAGSVMEMPREKPDRSVPTCIRQRSARRWTRREKRAR